MSEEQVIDPAQMNLRYASFQHRLGAIVLDATLMVFTR